QGVEGTFAVDSRFQKEQGVTCDRSVIMQEELGKAQWCPNGLAVAAERGLAFQQDEVVAVLGCLHGAGQAREPA
ncbi:hypothetical protein L0P09_10755, partial [Collinsella aerofaciens]